MLWKLVGLFLKMDCIEDRDSKADPSTTSITTNPATAYLEAYSTAMAPPMLCPTIIIIGQSSA